MAPVVAVSFYIGKVPLDAIVLVMPDGNSSLFRTPLERFGYLTAQIANED
jgi:hypothetical protein